MVEYGKEFAREGDDGDARKSIPSEGNEKGGSDLFNPEDMNGEGDKDAPQEPDHRYLGNVEEALDRRVSFATVFIFERIFIV
jgi:hypothetical protein